MTKQKDVDRGYVIAAQTEDGEVWIDHFDTREKAREVVKYLGGRKAGYKILQQFLFSREVR